MSAALTAARIAGEVLESVMCLPSIVAVVMVFAASGGKPGGLFVLI
jgi:hypothetical protein